MGGYFNTVHFNSIVVGTISGGEPPGGASSLSDLAIDVTKDWGTFGINNMGSLAFASGATIYSVGETLVTTGTIKPAGYMTNAGSIGIAVTIPVNSGGIENIYVLDGIIVGYNTVSVEATVFPYTFPFILG